MYRIFLEIVCIVYTELGIKGNVPHTFVKSNLASTALVIAHLKPIKFSRSVTLRDHIDDIDG